MKRLLRSISHHNVQNHHSDDDQDPVPPVPNPTRGALNREDSPSTREEMRRGMTLPMRLVSPSSFSDKAAFSKANGQPPSGTAAPTGSTQPRPRSATVTITAVSTEEKIWKAVNNPNGDVSKTEKFLNQVENDASAFVAISALGLAHLLIHVQEFGKAILNGVPALMSALESLSKVHPFAAAAFLPFQFAYKQEMKRHDNENLTICRMKGVGITPNDKQQTPDGQPVVTRLAALGQQMKKDIEECYNTLDAMQKQSLIVKFCKASGWNDKLAGFKVRFTTRRQELQFALTLNTATTIQDMSTTMHDEFMKEFQSFKTPQDRMIEAFFTAHGGVDEANVNKVMINNAECTMLLELQDDLTTTHTHNIQCTHAAGPERPRMDGAGRQEQHEPAVAVLRKEFRSDISSVIEENMESCKKRLDFSLHLLSEDLKNNIHKEGDRVINFLKGGPHLRLKDKIMRQVWKDQGWRGSAKTRTLVLALRDYLVERNEHADIDLPPPSTIPPSVPHQKEVQDPETSLGVLLPDNWALDYLQVRRLRTLQQVLDPDTSGFSTISEVNAFTQSRHDACRRWISYWVVGWQIYTTRYCTEIDNIFAEMLLIRDKVSMQMPGNKRYINNYISETWPFVVGLTSAIDRFEGTEWLADQFKEYIDAQETTLRSRLDRIHYNIDASDTVQEILRGEPIERSIFMLIAIIMRRHLLKMHLCLTMEMNDGEIYDDSYTVKFVVEAAWLRYKDLVDFFKNQHMPDMEQNFDWFSCGILMRYPEYFEWNEWTNEEYYKTNQIISYSAISEISAVKAEDLKGILLHEVTPAMFNSCLGDAKSAAAATGDLSPAIPETEALTLETYVVLRHTYQNAYSLLSEAQATSASLSELAASLSGVWFGFHATEVGNASSIRPGQTELTIEGEGSSFGRTVEKVGAIEGTATTTPNDVQIKVEFKQESDSDEYGYQGIFAPDLQIINGTCSSLQSDDYPDGCFLVKKTPTDSIMCYRPLVPRRLDARELWSFACGAVVGELNRRKPSKAYFFKRMKMIRRCLELLHSDDQPGETLELSHLRRAFTVQEYIEIQTLAGWYNRASNLQPPLYCDSCRKTITRSRVLCMQCGPSSVNFDAKEECISSSTIADRDDVIGSHLPTHLLLKTRDVLFLMDYPSVKSRALYCSSLATRLYSSARTVVGPAAANAGVSFSEVQTTTVTIAVEMTMPNEIDAGSPKQPPLPTVSPVNGNNSKSPVENFNIEVPKASSDSSIDSDSAPAQALASSSIHPDDTPSQISPPAAVSDTGDAHGTTEVSNIEPMITTTASEA
ncbi:hypothetical protein FB451DRAFT_1296459, partial [Mycena latifolia]